MEGTNRFKYTTEYLPFFEKVEPPILYSGWVTLGEIYTVNWNDQYIIATQYSRKSKIHRYYIIHAHDSIIMNKSSDVVLGPLTEYQRDSFILKHNIDLSKMKVLDFSRKGSLSKSQVCIQYQKHQRKKYLKIRMNLD